MLGLKPPFAAARIKVGSGSVIPPIDLGSEFFVYPMTNFSAVWIDLIYQIDGNRQ